MAKTVRDKFKEASKAISEANPVEADCSSKIDSSGRSPIIPIQPSKGSDHIIVSTGSTLLDLAISGERFDEGGIPGGILVEVFGPSGAGKTAILSEIAGNVQTAGGSVAFLDPEGRLDSEYARIYGVDIDKTNYTQPDLVSDLFQFIREWEPENQDTNIPNGIFTDSLAALSTEMEMTGEDKMGMRRAKEFSEGLRKTCRLIKKNNWLIVCSNQIRDGQMGTEVTPGGHGIPFYASLRIRIGPPAQNKYIKKTAKVSNRLQEKIIGIKSNCIVKKSSVDIPFRSAEVFIVFNYGIDDIRGNLQYIKTTKGDTGYIVADKSYRSIEAAIRKVEDDDLAIGLKQDTIALWREVQEALHVTRKRKQR